MSHPTRLARLPLIAAAALAASACTSAYTGPVEVTRFVSETPSALGQGEIALSFSEEVENERVRVAFTEAVSAQLRDLGYTLVLGRAEGMQSATLSTSRDAIEGGGNGRSPVSVGAGAGGGSFGGGVGLGVGINLGGGRSGPNVVTSLEVRISDPGGQALWEGRAQIPTSVNSPYSDVDAAAQALASALFKDFPGGNGETVSIDVDDL